MWSPILILAATVACASAHGRVLRPPSRASAWRLQFPTPADYDDDGLNCGGYATQHNSNGGKCGICGDAYNLPPPRPHELGGYYGLGLVVANYAPGALITTTVELTTSHRGFWEFKLCPDPDSNDQACFDKYILELEDGSTKFIPNEGSTKYDVVYKLPKGLTCDHCVLQWRYTAGNNWGVCKNGTQGLGCGPQEQFGACSDISIGLRNLLRGYVRAPAARPQNNGHSVPRPETNQRLTQTTPRTVQTQTNLQVYNNDKRVQQVTKQNQIAPHLNQVNAHLNQGTPHLNQGTPHLNQGSPYLNQVNPHLNQVTSKLNQVTSKLNQVTPHLNQITSHLNQGSPQLNQVTLRPNQHTQLQIQQTVKSNHASANQRQKQTLGPSQQRQILDHITAQINKAIKLQNQQVTGPSGQNIVQNQTPRPNQKKNPSKQNHHPNQIQNINPHFNHSAQRQNHQTPGLNHKTPSENHGTPYSSQTTPRTRGPKNSKGPRVNGKKPLKSAHYKKAGRKRKEKGKPRKRKKVSPYSTIEYNRVIRVGSW